MAEKKRTGRPSSYKPEYCKPAYGMALLGLKDTQIAAAFGVSEVTLNAWKNENPEFLKSLNDGKSLSDGDVAIGLFQRATGYSHPDVDIRVVGGEIVQTPIIKHYPPDTAACIFWLKNRQRELWRDKPEVKGDDDNELPPVVRVEIVDASRN